MAQRQRKSLQGLLTNGIEEIDDSFWMVLKQALEDSEAYPLDRRSILNLKMILNESTKNPMHLEVIVSLIRCLKPVLKTELANELAELVNGVVFREKYEETTVAVEFLKVLIGMAAESPAFKIAIFEDTLDSFLAFTDKASTVNPLIISAVFELYITLISKCSSNRKLLKEKCSIDHISKCLSIVQTCKDSLAQILVSEWMWRANGCLGLTEKEVKGILGKLSSTFLAISASKFRKTLHEFIRSVNKTSRASAHNNVLHSAFYSIGVGRIELNIRGWIDINKDSLAVWLLDRENYESLPDVVVFRLSFIEKDSFCQDVLEFSTKELIRVFGKLGEANPTSFSIKLEDPNPAVIGQFTYRWEKIQNKPKKRQAERKHNVAERRNRVYAAADEEIEKLQKDEPMKKKQKIPNTQEREHSLQVIEKMITEFHAKSVQTLDSVGEKFNSEIKDILSRLQDQSRMLKELAEQHKQITESTKAENEVVAASVKKLSEEFEHDHGETIRRRAAMSESMISELMKDKQKFVEETQTAYSNNVIVGFSHAMSNLQEICASLC